jgi:AmiR/NasT family two-component response regulator
MTEPRTDNLRILVAGERRDRLALVAITLAAHGHEVVAQETNVARIGFATIAACPDLAIVVLGTSAGHALGLVAGSVRTETCPVIVLVHARDPEFLREASKRRAFAFLTDGGDWQSTIDMTVRRHADYRELERESRRRAITERAKGILMERHAIDEATAFELLSSEARAANLDVLAVATALVETHGVPTPQPVAG